MKQQKNREYNYTVALAGSPNVGKSTIFNALTGLKQHTGNWTGKTVETAMGYFDLPGGERIQLIDLPGCYSLVPCSDEEAVAGDFLESGKADAVIAVLDANCLKRCLMLLDGITKLTSNVVVAVNLIDEAERAGIKIDAELLSERLSLPVILCAGRSGRGIPELKKSLEELLHSPKDEKACGSCCGSCTACGGVRAVQPSFLPDGVITGEGEGKSKKRAVLDTLLTNRFASFPIMLLMLLGILYITVVGANKPSEWLSSLFSVIGNFLSGALSFLPDMIRGALVDGVYGTLSRVVSVMLPPMAIFFPLFTLAEDFGLLPRLAFNLDRCFACCGSCGKQALTMCMGLGCNAVGVTGCRIIPGRKERLIAILTNCFVPCNGRFPLLIAVITLFFAGSGGITSALMLAASIILSVLVTLAVSFFLSRTLFRSQPSHFILELPPYRKPKVGEVIVRSILDRTLKILGRAAVVAAPAGLIIFVLSNIVIGNASVLSHICAFLDPLGRFMGLDGSILTAFILSFPANELVLPLLGMLYSSSSLLSDLSLPALGGLLIENAWTVRTALCFLIFTLFHWPCSTTLLTVKKETGSRGLTALAFLIPTAVGILLCAALRLLLP